MPPKKAGKVKGPTVMSEDAFQEMVKRKHLAAAWCTLLVPQADRGLLDAVLADASCQSRTVCLLNAEKQARTELIRTGDLEKAVQLARQFLTDHADDVPPSKTRTIEDVFCEKPLSKELQIILSQISAAVGEELFRVAGLCYTNAINANFFSCELGGLFSVNSDPIYIAEAPATDGGPATRINHLYDLRADLGELATGYVTKVSRAAASEQFQQTTLGDTPKAWDRFSDQLAAALHYMQSSSPQREGRDIPLQALVPQLLATVQNAYREGHSIITQHRRIKMIALQSDAVPEEEEEETPPPPEFEYKLTAMRAYRWVPDKETGRFRLQHQVPIEDRDRLGLLFDLPSYYRNDVTGDGLGSADDKTYFATLEHPDTDIIWLMLPSWVGHPPFTGYARDASPKHEPIYERICSPRAAGRLAHCREWCEGFSFKDPAPGEKRASLHELWLLGSAVAVEYGLTRSSESNRARFAESFERRREPIDLTCRHLLVKTYNEALRECAGYIARHAENPKAIFGGYISRAEDRGISFLNKRDADEYMTAKNKGQVKMRYKTEYPNNKAFHPT